MADGAVKGKPTRAAGATGATTYEFLPRRPPKRTGYEDFMYFLYDPNAGTVFGRTGKSWGELLLFYAIFYVILAALFAICMAVMLQTVDEREPKWQQESSLIGNNPGLGFRPFGDRPEEGSLIVFNPKRPDMVKKWVRLIDEFLEPYTSEGEGKQNRFQCDYTKEPPRGRVCAVNVTAFGPCSRANKYGYATASPCVFLKVNRIYGWTPSTYSDPNELPAEMPDDLKTHIKQLSPTEDPVLNQVWVSCSGEHAADRENVDMGFAYYPSRGFPGYYYPYENDEGYLSPLVAVQVRHPEPNVAINIECRAWARNIEYHGGNQQRKGSVHFEVMLDTVQPPPDQD